MLFFHIPTENYVRAGPHCLNVVKSSKFFKLTIIHPKELILEKTNNNKERKLNNLSTQSKLTSILHGLYCKYPSFGPATAIAKRWLFSHMIDTHLWPEILTELIFAEMFLNQLTTSTVQPQGLFFNFLNKISSFDPQYEMIVCNFNEELTVEQIEDVERRFRKNRHNFPPIMTLTSLADDSMWTMNAPSINVFQHVRLLAQKCSQLIEGNFMSLNSKQVSDVFSPSYTGFDVIIHLDSLWCRKFDIPTNFNFTKNAKNAKREQKITPPADIDHAQSFLAELREAFDEYAVFFFNPFGGTKIAVIFKPLMQKIKKGSVDIKQSITVEAMIHNISMIGEGLVTSIEVFD